MESRIGPYSIIRLIKRGGQGQVYLGYDRRLRRRVAIKIHRLPDSRRERRRMLREAQQVASIQSPRVVQIHDVIESREHLAMVMEYVPGCDLEELLREQRLSVASALTIGKDLAAALASARQQRLVHGDLKTSNVLVTEGGRAKLTDFGIARSADEPGYAESAGSLSALSPEQLQGRTLDVRTDLFALGCVMYRTLCGVHPFYRNDQFDARMLLEEEPVPLQERVPPEIELPAELVQLVAELLQKNPDDRPANTHRVRRLLRSASKQLPLATTDSLLREARPCFRAESQEDIPPRIPSGLRGKGRSRLDAGRWRDRFLRLRWSARLGLASLGILGLGVPLVYALQQAPLRVYFEAPVVNVVDARQLPAGVSGAWLVEEVRLALEEQVGPLRVSGAIPVRAYYAQDGDGSSSRSREQLQLSLHCSEVFCVFGLVRQGEDGAHYRQALLLPDMPLSRWRALVRETAVDLFE